METPTENKSTAQLDFEKLVAQLQKEWELSNDGIVWGVLLDAVRNTKLVNPIIKQP